jgi:hypothetical protein
VAFPKFKGLIKRTLKVYGVSEPVVISLTDKGVEMAIAGKKQKIYGSWDHIARNLLTPLSVPSWLAHKPIEFLKWQANSVKEKGDPE